MMIRNIDPADVENAPEPEAKIIPDRSDEWHNLSDAEDDRLYLFGIRHDEQPYKVILPRDATVVPIVRAGQKLISQGKSPLAATAWSISVLRGRIKEQLQP